MILRVGGTLTLFLCLHAVVTAQPAKKSTSPQTTDLKYLDLAGPGDTKPKLPYGRAFTISGKSSDVCIQGACGSGGRKLTDLLAPSSVGGGYIVEGRETPFAPSDIAGDSWTVSVGKLDENTAVTFRFAFSGGLSAQQAGAMIDELLSSQDYVSSLASVIGAAQKDSREAAVLEAAFGQTTATLVLDLLRERGVSPQNASDFGKRLSSPTARIFPVLVNLPSELRSFAANLRPQDLTKLGITVTMAPGDVYKHVTAALKAGALQSDKELEQQVRTFIGNYESLQKELAAAVTANILVQVSATAFDVSEDLKKYAGFDVGAIYSPRLQEFRSFATANIYLGAVELHPGARNFFRQRGSLTLGMALKDLSGHDADKTKIKGNDAFLYGVGFRLNKYFRLTTGGMMYRAQLPAVNGVSNPSDNKLRHEFFFGPSIDITALPALEKIFAKSKS